MISRIAGMIAAQFAHEFMQEYRKLENPLGQILQLAGLETEIHDGQTDLGEDEDSAHIGFRLPRRN